MKKLLLKLSALLLLIFGLQNNSNAQIGTWTELTNASPDYNEGVMVLMTDGSVMCFSNTNHSGGASSAWDKLTPDAHGSYINGTWTREASFNNSRLFFATQVLPSGKLYAAGGEYGTGTKGEVYDPVANTWTSFNVPNGWNDYDGNSELLYNGDVLEGPQISTGGSEGILIWNPATITYATGTQAPLNHDEAAWLKLPDSTVLYIDCPNGNGNANKTCRYQPTGAGTWLNDANTPNNIYDQWGQESGCALQLPNGKDIFFGSTQYNVIYTPSGNSETAGTWAAAANMPTISGAVVGQVDAPGAMMVNGHILLGVSPGNTSAGDQFRSPIWFIEYDYTTNTFTQVTSVIPGIGADSIAGVPCNFATFLDLPDGNVLFSIEQEGVNNYWEYTPGSAAIAAGKPVFDSIAIRAACGSYEAFGKLFNGISEGASFGDDWQMATNYPLVRLTNGTNVWYAKTTNWNRIGFVAGNTAATDSLLDSCTFTLPAGLSAATTYTAYVVVNGFQSNPVLLTTLGSTIASQTNVSCHGENNGSITANTGVGGIAPYTYSWAPGGSSTLTVSSLSAGTYTLTVTDKEGCTATTSVTITQPATLTDPITVSQDVSCRGGNNGVLTDIPAGGTLSYSYLWTGGGTTAAITALVAGSYTVTVTDHNGCTATASATITQPAADLTSTITSHTNIICNGGSTGSATGSAAGGTAPYTYNWAPSGGTNAIASGLSSGTYTITITDHHGCTATISATLTQPTALAVVIDSINVSGSSGCNGEASVNVSGGTAPYTYNWSPGGGTNDTIDGKCAGNYCCTVKDKNGCSTTVCITIGTTGIENISNAPAINIYPDPNNGSFTVSGVITGQIIEIYNDLGQKISTSIAGNNSMYINISAKPDGIYLVRISNTDGSLVKEQKILKVQ